MNINNEQNLIESLAGLPRERQPSHDLWPGIKARLQDNSAAEPNVSTRKIPRRLGIAAMLAVAVISAYQIGLRQGSVVDQETLVAAIETYRHNNLSNEYIGAIREAAALTSQQTETRMPAETVTEMQSSMKSILETEMMLREAIKAEPANEYLAMLLVRLQSRQLKLLQNIPHIEQQIWRTL